ncbi:flagellar protein FlgN [Leptospira ilyithenensis]|uniref:Flagellar protein FlgN n=1 Tax=Leptospira ilyithenensis TaxID=2484901 RepID=A0A4R9LT91_9LEPT|nr:flagellar protein FlgN [Leptospira ilyithenensis]TGN13416.1 flagellar protein FlgN [Leptospira ilyithenensis]
MNRKAPGISFYEKKYKLLSLLFSNLREEEKLLSYGDADSAVKLEFKNESIIRKLETLDREAFEANDSYPASEEEIEFAEKVFHLLDEARNTQLRVQNLLEKEMNSAKKELWEFRVKRKLKNHFLQNSGLSWTKNYC